VLALAAIGVIAMLKFDHKSSQGIQVERKEPYDG
jgi:hypothetical protein